MTTDDAAPTVHRTFRVLLVLPPDFEAPPTHKLYRFPPQGPALVAASVAGLGYHIRAVDLEDSIYRRPLVGDFRLLDTDAFSRHMRGMHVEGLELLASDLIDRIPDPHCDGFAFSLDRHTQIRISCLLGYELKRRYGTPILLGGANTVAARQQMTSMGVKGIDLATFASTPGEIRAAFAALRELPRGRRERAAEPVHAVMTTKGEDWPPPDYSIYDLSLYRRDPFRAESKSFGCYDGSIGPSLVLPYHFTWDCQYVCSFCQRGGSQSWKPIPQVVRELATLAETWGTRDFIFFDAQINLLAEELANALIEARVDVHWTDSYRVRPSRPGALELLARAGCVGLTFGVESASDKVLRSMRKGHLAWHATRVLEEAQANQIMSRVNLLPCFPGETREDFVETRDWLEQNAHLIDDIAPSSFYMAEGSPVGLQAEKYNIKLRGQRLLMGDHKFRKNQGSLEYDEIGGMTWEERQATLRPAEEELRVAWERGRGKLGAIKQLPAALHFAMRRAFATKEEAYAAYLKWMKPAPPAVPKILSPSDAPDALSARFDLVIGDAIPRLTKHLGNRLAAHMILFSDNDYICFRGEVDGGGESKHPPGRIFIESVLASRFLQSSRRHVYGRFLPGSSIELSDDRVRAQAGSEPWEVPLRYGKDFHVLSFGPPA